jgi:hypothetical protein
MPDYRAYAPQQRPVEVCEGVWTIEGPIVPFRVGPFTIPCPTRCTVLADAEGGLWLHSPIRFSPSVAEAVRSLGTCRGIIAPNRFHCAHMPHWADAFPEAKVLAARGTERRLAPVASDRIHVADECEALGSWLDLVLVDGGSWTELICFHRSSQTLIFTDLIQGFELERVHGRLASLLLRFSGAGRGPVISSELLWLAWAAGAYGRVRGQLARLARFPAVRILIAHGRQPGTDTAEVLARLAGSPRGSR